MSDLKDLLSRMGKSNEIKSYFNLLYLIHNAYL